MKRGSPRDFWRAVDAGLRLAKLGWIPWSLRAGRRVGSGTFQDLCLTRAGCHAGVRPERGRATTRGVRSMKDLLAPAGRAPSRVKLSDARRARLIREALPWLRKSGWTAFSVNFRKARRGRRWTLVSDVHFNRGEGLYWSNSLTAPKGAGVDRELMDAGFRVYPREPGQWYFHRDFLPPSRLLKTAAWLAAWRPALR